MDKTSVEIAGAMHDLSIHLWNALDQEAGGSYNFPDRPLVENLQRQLSELAWRSGDVGRPMRKAAAIRACEVALGRDDGSVSARPATYDGGWSSLSGVSGSEVHLETPLERLERLNLEIEAEQARDAERRGQL